MPSGSAPAPGRRSSASTRARTGSAAVETRIERPDLARPLEGRVWAVSPGEGKLARISVATNKVTARLTIGGGPADGWLGPDGLLWIPNLQAEHGHADRPGEGEVVDRIHVGTGPFVVRPGFGDMWAMSYGGTDIWRLHAG